MVRNNSRQVGAWDLLCFGDEVSLAIKNKGLNCYGKLFLNSTPLIA